MSEKPLPPEVLETLGAMPLDDAPPRRAPPPALRDLDVVGGIVSFLVSIALYLAAAP